MSKETTYAGMLGDWQRWIAALWANVSDLAHLEVQRSGLETLTGRAQELIRTQSEMAAAKQEASRELREVMVEGQRLVTVVKLAVKQHYGIDSEKLVEFGVQPFRGLPRRKPAEPPVEPPPVDPPSPPVETLQAE